MQTQTESLSAPNTLGQEGGADSAWRFEEYEFHTCPFALFKEGHRVALRPQPAKLLRLLLHNAGRTVDRTTIKDELWGSDVHVDFEQGINFVVRQLRKALGDTPRAPRFLETVPQVGYRFVARAIIAPNEPEASTTPRLSSPIRWLLFVLAVLGVVGILRLRAPFDGGPPKEAGIVSADWVKDSSEAWKRGILLSKSEKPKAQAKGLALLHQAVRQGAAPDCWRQLLAIKELQLGSLERAVELGESLLRESPDSPEGHFVLGYVLLFRDYEWAVAEEHLKSAARSKAMSERANFVYAKLLSASGRHLEALTLAKAILSDDPFSPEKRRLLARLSLNARLFDEAIALAEPLLELRDQDAEAHWILIFSNYLSGKDEETRLRARDYLKAWGRAPGAAESLSAFWELSFHNGVGQSPNHLAFLLNTRGNLQGALMQLAVAACGDDRASNKELIFVGVDPTLDTIRQDPGFAKVRACLNLSG